MDVSSRAPKPHILIIEDDESLRSMLENKLYQVGYSVTVAATGKHALQKFKSGKAFDLVICDLKMPNMSGLDLFRAFKQMGMISPFVILTGHPDREKIVELIRLGVTDVILKPIRHMELLERIKIFLAGRTDPIEGSL